jgi:SAM-dependent methyltransferase
MTARLFASLSDEEWLVMLRRSVTEEVINGIRFPRFPDAVTQANFVGSSNENALQEAHNFYSFLKRASVSMGTPVSGDSPVLDFGCGWGRYLRFFWKDVDASNLYGVDVDPDVVALCLETGAPGTIRVLERDGRLPFPDAFFSHVLAYSVFTHLPERTHLHWMKEIARVTKPGASFCLTLEPRRFLDFVSSLDERTAETPWHRSLSRFASLASNGRRLFDSGEFVYLPTGGGGEYREPDVYGEAVVPVLYIERNWKGFFRPVEYVDDPSRFWQAALAVQRLS